MKDTIEFKNKRRWTLTEERIKNARKNKKERLLNDDGGLVLLVGANYLRGGLWFVRIIMKDMWGGIEEGLIPFGFYPDKSIEEARRERDDIQKQITEQMENGVYFWNLKPCITNKKRIKYPKY